MGVNGAFNTVEEMSTPTILFVSGRLQSTIPAGVQGMVPGIVVLTCAPCLAFSVRPLVPFERASPVGWPQSALVAPVGEER